LSIFNRLICPSTGAVAPACRHGRSTASTSRRNCPQSSGSPRCHSPPARSSTVRATVVRRLARVAGCADRPKANMSERMTAYQDSALNPSTISAWRGVSSAVVSPQAARCAGQSDAGGVRRSGDSGVASRSDTACWLWAASSWSLFSNATVARRHVTAACGARVRPQ